MLSIKVGAIAFYGVGYLAAAAVLSSCITPSTSTQEERIAAADIAENHESLMGQTVTVRNDIQEIISEKAFILDKDQLLSGETVLVIDASGTFLGFPKGEGTEVQVSGKVEQFVLAELEQEYDLELEPNQYTEYENKPVLIAHSVVLSPDPGDVTKNPEAYYDREIAVEGEVEETMAAGIFKLDEEQVFGGEDLLVIAATPEVEAQEDEIVVVTGVVRPFVLEEFEREYELNWNLSVKEEIEAEYANIPVLVAQEVFSLRETDD